MQLKALVTGANGMLGDSLCPFLEKKGYIIFPTDINTVINTNDIKLDIRILKDVRHIIKMLKPHIVFHLAAETGVDKCELNKEHAYEINSKGTEHVAVACKEHDIPLVYISTGAVFDGNKIEGYIELDKPSPINVYGKSKLNGEQAVCSLLEKYFIIRAGWMIGGYNKDKKFVWKIVQLLKTKKEISAVTDKIGSPTFTKDFSNGMHDIISWGKYGTYHCVNNGICTRFDIAKKIIEFLNKRDVVLRPVTSDAFPLPAPRGKSEALINYNLSRIGRDHMRPWQNALKEYLKNLP